EDRGEARQFGFADCQPGGVGMPAELRDEPRGAFGREVQGVAQMEAGDLSSGALELAVASSRENDCRAVIPVLEPPCDDADDPLVPVRMEEAERVSIGIGGLAH